MAPSGTLSGVTASIPAAMAPAGTFSGVIAPAPAAMAPAGTLSSVTAPNPAAMAPAGTISGVTTPGASEAAVLRSEPIRLSYPITTTEAPKRSRSRDRYSAAVRAANVRVKGITSTRSMPERNKSAFFSSSDDSSRKSRASCCSTVRGCGQKVTTTASSPLSRAEETTVSST